MKKDIHPEYREITVIMTDGTEYKTRSTSKQDVIRLDVDPLSHPVWQGGGVKITSRGQLDKFNSRFGNFLGGAKEDGKGNSKSA